jgi:bile acid:Na+ symporter, BASS family
VIAILVRAFPLWAVLLSALAWIYPQWFVPFRGAIVPLLALVMFGMGLTLGVADFRRVLRRPVVIAFGVFLQYTVMPAAAWLVSRALQLDPMLTTGMILVGTSPGGTASNVICYLARGDVALSVTLTAVSTLLSIMLTPLLCLVYIDARIAVPAGGMLLSILEIVIAPVLLGVLLNGVAHRQLRPLQQYFPLVSVAAIVWIIAIVVAINRPRFDGLGWLPVFAVAAHNAVGLAVGYLAPRLLGYNERVCRTLAIETGMQNSGMAVALAVKFFAPVAAVPGAAFSIWHNLSGSLLAAVWRRRD